MTKHVKYQDYVIKDGVFIGEFEEMYRDFEDPWEQSTREKHAIEKKIGLDFIRQHDYKRIVEFGCGFGDYTNQLNDTAGDVLGIDISETAIRKAKQKYPRIRFSVGDILDFDLLREYQPDCIVLAEISWYILDKIDEFQRFLKNEYYGGEVAFLHTLMTYSPGEQKYGGEYFSDLQGIMNYWTCVDFLQWGEISKKEYQGGKRTFCFGLIK